MSHIRVSATDIDALRYFLSNEDSDLDQLLAQLRRQSAPTENMMAGTALHKALELSQAGDYSSLSADGFDFDIEADAEIDLPDIREIKATKVLFARGVEVTLVGKVDAVLGKRIDDHKFTTRFDPERFLTSYQWRIYLSIFGADQFRWNIFEASEIGVRHYKIKNVHPLNMSRYPGMETDILRAVEGFVDFARIHLPEKFTEVAA